MYCRDCEYDLRGQVEPRCPECGRAYDPHVEDTFLHRPRILPVSMIRFLSGVRSVVAVCTITLALMAHFMVPSLTDCAGPVGAMYPNLNLRRMISMWHILSRDDPPPHNVDVGRLAKVMTPSYGPWEHADGLRWMAWSRKVHRSWYYAIVFDGAVSLLLLLMYANTPGLMRRGSACVLAGVIGILVFFSVMDHRHSIRAGCDFSYFSDYVFVNGLAWSVDRRDKDEIIVAFSRKPSPLRGNRMVGFMSGSVHAVSEKGFQELLVSHGLDVMTRSEANGFTTR